MADKDTIDTNHFPNAPNSNTPGAATKYFGSTDSNSQNSMGNRKFAPYSTNRMKD